MFVEGNQWRFESLTVYPFPNFVMTRVANSEAGCSPDDQRKIVPNLGTLFCLRV